MNNREAFEAWAEKELLPLDRRDSEHYRYNLTNRAWAGWKACLASQQDHIGDGNEMAKHQPCGCVICTCEHETQCQGCGAKHCGTHEVGNIPNPVYLQSQAQQTESKPVAWGYAWQCKSVGDWRIEKLGEGCIPPKDTLALYTLPPAPEGE